MTPGTMPNDFSKPALKQIAKKKISKSKKAAAKVEQDAAHLNGKIDAGEKDDEKSETEEKEKVPVEDVELAKGLDRKVDK